VLEQAAVQVEVLEAMLVEVKVVVLEHLGKVRTGVLA